ncbi:hypothetical protein TCAL_14664 [Tigriopus californicus]|uniref:Dual specificity protein phosphatase 23 n=1 Tax=Tigriopus californicus TaxID=6832 RepID=A0A553NPC0_TIGCA|nr:dual specificity protein phosphatase 23-like [Tigriopus californicus]TRY67288.1 hypothetical protein TCAL_14664 [Tigriopus californicus]
MSSPRNFSWIFVNKLAGSSCPRSEAEMAWLKRQNIKHIVTLSDDFLPPQIPLVYFKHKHIFVQEFQAPNLSQIKDFIAYCHRVREQHESLLVHCRQGLGRTGVMLACYLVEFEGMNWRVAIQRVRELRPWSIETKGQEIAVHDYYAHRKKQE